MSVAERRTPSRVAPVVNGSLGRGVASLRDAGANTYTPIYALCADAGQFAVSLHKSPVAPAR